jgi:tmRNA-binding protein
MAAVTSGESKKTKRLKEQETKRRRRAMSALFVFWNRARLRQLIKQACGKRKRDKVRVLDTRTGRD